MSVGRLRDLNERVSRVLQLDTEDFVSLALAGGLDPAMDFKGADLAGVDLSREDLRTFDFTGARLTDANLSHADLRGVDLSGADLRQANLAGADLRGARLEGADLQDAVVTGTVLEDEGLHERQTIARAGISQVELLNRLRRWAHGRLPASLRAVVDAGDLVQDAVIAALQRFDLLDPRHRGSLGLEAYLRQAITNRIGDLARQHQRDSMATQPDHLDDPLDPGASPLDRAIGAENLERYDSAMRRLHPADREAIIGRLELQYSYAELAALLDKPTPDAARMAVTRALARLQDEISRG